MEDVRATYGLDLSAAYKAIDELAARLNKLTSGKGLALPVAVKVDDKAFQQVDAQLRNATPSILHAKVVVDDAGIAAAGTSSGATFASSFKGSFKSITDSFKTEGASGLLGGFAGGAAIGLATSAISAVGSAISTVMDLGKEFETGLQSLSAVTGATGPLLDTLGQNARDLATTFGGSANEQLGVFQTTLSKIGPQLAQSPKDLKTFAENVNTLSKTDSALGAAGAVDALTGAMLQFGVNVNDSNEVAQESSRFINVLAASAGVGSASVSQVAESIAVVGATAKNANVSFEETNAALQVLASKSLVGSQAGTGLTTVLNKLQAQSGDGDKALKKLGTSSAELGKLLNTGGIGPAMNKLREAMSKLGSQAEKNALLNKLFGEGGQNAAAALLGGKDMLDQFTKGVTGTNAATEQAATNMATVAERMSRLKATVEDFGIGLYQKIQPVINAIFDAVGIITNALGPIISKTMSALGGTFQRIWTIVKPILMGIGAAIITNIVTAVTIAQTVVTTVFSVINKIFDSVVRALKPIKDAFEKAFGSFGDGVDPMKLFTDALEILTTVISETGGFIADLAGIVIEFVTVPLRFISEGVAKLIGLFGSQSKETKGMSDATKKAQTPIQMITGFFDKLRGTMAGVTEVVKVVIDVFIEFYNAITSLDFAKAGEAFANLGDRIRNAYDKGYNSTIKQIQDARTQSELAAQEAAANAEAGADAVDEKKKKEKSALQIKREEYDIIKNGLEAERSILVTKLEQQRLEGKITEEEKKRRLLNNDAETQQKLADALRKTFGIIEDADGHVASISVRVDPEKDGKKEKVLADFTKEVNALLLGKITAEISLKTDPKVALDAAQALLKDVDTAFKEGSDSLAATLLSPDAFLTQSEELRAKLGAEIATLKTVIGSGILDKETIEKYEQQIKELAARSESISRDSAADIVKIDSDLIAKRVDLNKQELELLKKDEKANRAAILKLSLENVAAETDLKLRALKTTGELRDRETALILQGAQSQTDELKKLYGELPGALESFALDAAGRIAAAFRGTTEEQKKQREDALKVINDEEKLLAQSRKNGTLAYAEFNQRYDDLQAKRAAIKDEPSILENVFTAVTGSAFTAMRAKIDEFSAAAVAKFNELSKGGKIAFDQLGLVMAGTFGTTLIGALEQGKDAIKGLLAGVADAAVSALDLLAPIISAQFLAFLGIFALPAAQIAIAGLKALLNSARSALGFWRGGLIPNGERMIRVNEKGQEGVVNASATAKYWPVIDAMNKGYDPLPLLLKNYNSNDILKKLDLEGMGIRLSRNASLADAFSQVITDERAKTDVLIKELRHNRETMDKMSRDMKDMKQEIIRMRQSNDEIETETITNITIPFDKKAIEAGVLEAQYAQVRSR